MKKLLVLLLCLIVCGCEQKPLEKKEEKRGLSPTLLNTLNEDLELLAVKYSIGCDTLLGIINDYEKLTRGYSLTRLYGTDKKKEVSPKAEIVNIRTAIDTISNKYQIPKATIGSILIDKNMMDSWIGGDGEE
jgi:hypothetical protein